MARSVLRGIRVDSIKELRERIRYPLYIEWKAIPFQLNALFSLIS